MPVVCVWLRLRMKSLITKFNRRHPQFFSSVSFVRLVNGILQLLDFNSMIVQKIVLQSMELN